MSQGGRLEGSLPLGVPEEQWQHLIGPLMICKAVQVIFRVRWGLGGSLGVRGIEMGLHGVLGGRGGRLGDAMGPLG